MSSYGTYKVVGSQNDTNNIHVGSSVYISGGTQNLYAPTFYVDSDERLKDFKNDIEIDFNKLKLLPKKYFTWKDSEFDNRTHIGTSAQELQKIYPSLTGVDEKGYMNVNYGGLNVVSLKAIDLIYEKQEELNDRMNIILSKIN